MLQLANAKQKEQVIELWKENIVRDHDFIPAMYWQALAPIFYEQYIVKYDTLVQDELGEVVGILVLTEDSEILSLIVDQAHRGRGIGSEMIDRLKEMSEELHVSIYMKNVKLKNFLKKRGFVEQYKQTDKNTGEEECYLSWRKNELQ